MTIKEFENRLQKMNPRLHIRQRGYGDIVGVFDGSRYIIRMSKGEFNLSGYRQKFFNNDMSTSYGTIQKRGRKTVVKMLEKMGYIKSLKDRASLLWGV